MMLKTLLQPDLNIYKYQLKERIGGGFFGDVWLAHDLTISRTVAVKILDGNMSPIAEHLKEAQVGNKLEHQNVIKVHYADVASINGHNAVLIAMDYHPTGSILRLLNSSNFVPLKQAITLGIDVLRGLEYLHEQNLFHNDIKPSNILIGPRSEGILTDYGISCLSTDLQPAQAPNTYILHRAPETTLSNEISVLTDIYQTGITLFRLINGIGLIRELRSRVGCEKFEELKALGKAITADDYQLFVPTRIKKIISKATDPDPTKRYQSALEMRRALESIRIYGDWTTDERGNFIGRNDYYSFTFEKLKSNQSYKFDAFKQKNGTTRKTRVVKMCGLKLSEKEGFAKQKEFMLSVVSGEI